MFEFALKFFLGFFTKSVKEQQKMKAPFMHKGCFLKTILLTLLLVLNVGSIAQVAPGKESLQLKTEVAIDSHGVDLIGGEPIITGSDLSLGNPVSGLSYTDSSWNGARTEFKGSITKMQSDSDSGDGCQRLPKGLYYSVSSGKETAIFKSLIETNFQYLSADQLVLVSGQGSLIYQSGIFVYTSQDGTEYKFDTNIIFSSAGDNLFSSSVSCSTQVLGTLVSVLKPDGEKISIGYKYYGLVSGFPIYIFDAVTSSLGWMVKKQLSESSGNLATSSGLKIKQVFMAINTSEEYCGAAPDSCLNLTKSWQKSTLSETYSEVGEPGPSDFGVANLKYTGVLTNALGKDTSLSYEYSTPTLNFDTVLRHPSGATKVYTKSLCAGTQPTIEGCQNNINKRKVVDIKYGTNAFSYSRRHVLPISAPGKDQLEESTGPDGQFLLISANSGFPLAYVDKLSRTTKYIYADKWRVSDKVDNDATGISAGLDIYTGKMYSVNPPSSGGYTHADYDSRGNITSITAYPKNSGTPLVTTAEYPTDCDNPKTCNKPTSITDQNGVVTSYDYYPEHGGLKSVTKAAVDGVEAQTLYTYEQKTPYVKNSSNTLVASPQVWRLVSVSKCMTQTLNTCAGTADELRTEYGDFTNNLLSKKTTVKHGDGSVVLETTRDYDIYGNVTWEDGPRPGSYDTSYYFYDALRQKIGEIGVDPDGSGPLPRQATSIGYNDDGKVNSIKKGIVLGTSKASLDAMTVKEEAATEYSTVHGLPIVESYLANGVLKKLIQKSYNADLRLECVAHRLSFSTALDACTPSSATETYGENSVAVKDRITKYTYDATGAVLTTSTGVGTSLVRTDRTNVYRPDNGLLASEADALGNTTSYGYDDFNRSTRTTYPKVGSDAATYTEKSYTSGKNFVSSVLLRDGQSIGFTPDALYRIGAKTGAVVESFSYNNFDQVTSHTNNTTGGVAATSIYNRKAIGWLNYEQTAFGNVSYEYDAYGRRTKMTWPDNVFINYSYETNGYAGDQLQTITDSNNATLASFDYYDTGKRKTLTRGNGVVTSYGYDTLQRLETYGTDIGGTDTANDIAEIFSYTLAGQLKNRKLTTNNADYTYLSSVASNTTYVPNALNQIATLDGVAFEYDKRGNLTKDNVGVTYEYNANNLLLSSTNTNGSASLRYDAENRLYSVTKGSNTMRFMYDGTDLIAETNRSNTILRRYIHGPETDDPIVWYEGAGTTDKRYYTTDRQGSIVGTTLQTGVNAAINAYDEYGIQKYPAFGRFQYTGQTWLPEVGLYYYKARLYSPTLGRFMQTDPIGYKDGMNWYAYVGNDSVNYIDLTGESRFNRHDHSGIAMAGLIAKVVATYSEPGSSANKTANEVDRVTARAMDAYADDGAAKKNRNKVAPVKEAEGPHSAWKTDPKTGEKTRTETYTPNAQNPTGHDKVKSVDITGAPHRNKETGEAVPTPHAQGRNDDGTLIPGGVRPATPEEIPKPAIKTCSLRNNQC